MARRLAPLLLTFLACKGGKPEIPTVPETRAEPRRDPAPEVKPHPDYPTPALAGTQELFLLEEPPRGPHVTDVKLPDRSLLKFSDHAYCELTLSRLTCSAAKARSQSSARWNVGRSGDHVVLAERLSPSGHVLETVL